MTTTKRTGSDRRISGFVSGLKPAPVQHISLSRAGQSCPQQRPGLEHVPNALGALGEPLTIRMVSQMLGCSAWTVRQRYIPEGLPHLRSGPAGKLVFFQNQVVQWILQQQNNQNPIRKGGR